MGNVSASDPVKILHDTVATQTSELNMLLFDDRFTAGAIGKTQYDECRFITVPLHWGDLVSEMMSESAVLGVMNTLPVNVLLINNTTGGDSWA